MIYMKEIDRAINEEPIVLQSISLSKWITNNLKWLSDKLSFNDNCI